MTTLLTCFVPHLAQSQNLNFPNKHRFSNRIVTSCSLRNPSLVSPSEVALHAQRLVEQFNPRIAIEKAITPPTSWYTDPSFHQLELDRIFYRGWQAVGQFSLLLNQDHFLGHFCWWGVCFLGKSGTTN